MKLDLQVQERGVAWDYTTMAPKKRPPQITQLTAERRKKAAHFHKLVVRTKKYCGQATEEIQSATYGESVQTVPTVERSLRSQVTKELFALTVLDCQECDGRTVEAFQHEYEDLMVTSPLQCNHGKIISTITALGPQKRDYLQPPITIPAQQPATTLRRSGSLQSVASTVSSVNKDKL